MRGRNIIVQLRGDYYRVAEALSGTFLANNAPDAQRISSDEPTFKRLCQRKGSRWRSIPGQPEIQRLIQVSPEEMPYTRRCS